MPETFRYSYPDLLRDTFGTAGYALVIRGVAGADGPPPEEKYPDIPVLEVEAVDVRSLMGTPILQPVTLRSQDGRELRFQDAPMIDVTSQKHIVSTPISGGNGTVKELISEKDDTIRLRGALCNYAGEAPPLDLIRELREFYRLGEALEVDNIYLNELGIFNIVVERMELPDPETVINVQPYVLSCLSDKPVELELAEEALTKF